MLYLILKLQNRMLLNLTIVVCNTTIKLKKQFRNLKIIDIHVIIELHLKALHPPHLS